MDRPLVFLDTETATTHGPPHLIELACVRVVDGDAVDQFCELVRPEVPIDERATEVHGLVVDDLRTADGAPEVLHRFCEWLEPDDWIVAHNAKFDAHVLGFELARARIEPPRNTLFDSLKLARKGLPESPDHKLETLIEHLGLDVETTHRALADAVACWQVFEAALANLCDPPTESAVLEHAMIGGTLAEHLPLPPSRLKRTVRRLERAATDERIVTLVYGDETARPSELAVLPKLLYAREKKGYLEGECQSSGVLKTYRLDRIHKILEPR